MTRPSRRPQGPTPRQETLAGRCANCNAGKPLQSRSLAGTWANRQGRERAYIREAPRSQAQKPTATQGNQLESRRRALHPKGKREPAGCRRGLTSGLRSRSPPGNGEGSRTHEGGPREEKIFVGRRSLPVRSCRPQRLGWALLPKGTVRKEKRTLSRHTRLIAGCKEEGRARLALFKWRLKGGSGSGLRLGECLASSRTHCRR